MKRVETLFPVPGGELCAGCYGCRTNMWSPTKDVPVCDKCSKKLRVKDLPDKDTWWDTIEMLKKDWKGG